MELNKELIDILKIFGWESLESSILCSFNVYLENNALIGESFGINDIFEGRKGVFLCYFCVVRSAHIHEIIFFRFIRAMWRLVDRTIIHMVDHVIIFGDLASELVILIHPNVNQSLGVLHMVIASDVPSVKNRSQSHVLAICVLKSMLVYVVGLEQFHCSGIPSLKLLAIDLSSVKGVTWFRDAHSRVSESWFRMVVLMSEWMFSFQGDAVVDLLNPLEMI